MDTILIWAGAIFLLAIPVTIGYFRESRWYKKHEKFSDTERKVHPPTMDAFYRDSSITDKSPPVD